MSTRFLIPLVVTAALLAACDPKTQKADENNVTPGTTQAEQREAAGGTPAEAAGGTGDTTGATSGDTAGQTGTPGTTAPPEDPPAEAPPPAPQN